MDTSPIIIAGGGIAGLASALAFGAHSATILERAPVFSTAGAGLQIGPNAVRALQTLGAWDAVQAYTSKPREIQFRDGLSGNLIKRLSLGSDFAARYGADYHVAHRAGLHAGLLEVVRSKPNLTLELGQTLEHVEIGTRDVQVRVKSRSRRASGLIATDGVQSLIRQLHFPASIAVNSGATFHRALMPLIATGELQLDCVTVWMLPGGHVVHYAVGKPEQSNIVAITPDGATPLSFFERATPSLATLLQAATPYFTTWPGLYVRPLPKWTVGHALLLGDAAHGTLPYMAQGAAMALEDAACLAGIITRTHSLRHAFAETAKRRIPRTIRLHRETLQTGKIYHLRGTLRHLRNVGMVSMPEVLMHMKLNWLYKSQ